MKRLIERLTRKDHRIDGLTSLDHCLRHNAAAGTSPACALQNHPPVGRSTGAGETERLDPVGDEASPLLLRGPSVVSLG